MCRPCPPKAAVSNARSPSSYTCIAPNEMTARANRWRRSRRASAQACASALAAVLQTPGSSLHSRLPAHTHPPSYAQSPSRTDRAVADRKLATIRVASLGQGMDEQGMDDALYTPVVRARPRVASRCEVFCPSATFFPSPCSAFPLLLLFAFLCALFSTWSETLSLSPPSCVWWCPGFSSPSCCSQPCSPSPSKPCLSWFLHHIFSCIAFALEAYMDARWRVWAWVWVCIPLRGRGGYRALGLASEGERRGYSPPSSLRARARAQCHICTYSVAGFAVLPSPSILFLSSSWDLLQRRSRPRRPRGGEG
ncbi:hypothetical protein C8R45DRAFT_989305 [Mycena sanguinolenta]|nr:hypothetical protein C8R45DRAFT_989305 [Mycena sanguinolenta]